MAALPVVILHLLLLWCLFVALQSRFAFTVPMQSFCVPLMLSVPQRVAFFLFSHSLGLFVPPLSSCISAIVLSFCDCYLFMCLRCHFVCIWERFASFRCWFMFLMYSFSSFCFVFFAKSKSVSLFQPVQATPVDKLWWDPHYRRAVEHIRNWLPERFLMHMKKDVSPPAQFRPASIWSDWLDAFPVRAGQCWCDISGLVPAVSALIDLQSRSVGCKKLKHHLSAPCIHYPQQHLLLGLPSRSLVFLPSCLHSQLVRGAVPVPFYF